MGVWRDVVFQCSSASRKFLNWVVDWLGGIADYTVSVLFSEPKIPQSEGGWYGSRVAVGFSALQRAENSSMPSVRAPPHAP